MAKLTARDLMAGPVLTTTPEATLGEAATLILEKKVSCLPVLDQMGDLVGIISHSDFTPTERHLPFTNERLRATAWPQGAARQPLVSLFIGTPVLC
jgi:CBS-domain-containing membrane protein